MNDTITTTATNDKARRVASLRAQNRELSRQCDALLTFADIAKKAGDLVEYRRLKCEVRKLEGDIFQNKDIADGIESGIYK